MVFGPLAYDRRSTPTGRGDGVAGIRREACPEHTGIVGPGPRGRALPIDEPEFGNSCGGSSQVSSEREDISVPRHREFNEFLARKIGRHLEVPLP